MIRVAKPLLNLVSLKLIWQRITFSKVTASFFTLALVHCVIQVSLEAFAFNVNASALNLLREIVAAGAANGTVPTGIAIFDNKNLTVCTGVPSADNCHVVWSVRPNVTGAAVNVSDVDSMPWDDYAPASDATPAFSAGGVVALNTGKPTVTKTVTVLVTPPAALHAGEDGPAVVAVADHDHTPSGDIEVHFDKRGDTFKSPTKRALIQDNGGSKDGFSGDTYKDAKKRNDASVTQTFNSSTGAFLGVLIVDPHLKGGQLLASPTCIESLQVPIQSLRNSRRVDLTFIAFQIWVLGMSVVALLNESVPHIAASLVTHLVATGWSVYQVRMTQDFRGLVTRLIVQGPCRTNLLPNYWDVRRNTEISVAVLNAAVMVAIGFLSYKLVKSFGWQTFKRVGASLVINRVYRIVLAFSIAIQLSVFFIGANVTLWIDQLYNGNIARYAMHRHAYEVIYIIVLCVLLPWLTMGWFAVRRESRFWMHTFLVIGAVMISGWMIMFASSSFRWTFRMWDFFAFITVVAAVLLICTIAMGAWCRFNFGRGLPRYLNSDQVDADEPAFEDMDTKSFDDEKCVEFPSRDSTPVPTFAVAFGEGAAVLPALQRIGGLPGISMHARSGSVSAGEPAPLPAAAAPVGRSRADSDASGADSSAGLGRSGSVNSTGSTGSERSGHSEMSGRGKRWLIE